MSTPWSIEEVEAAVADYFQMLTAELRGEPYSKAEHRRALLPRLNRRSEGAVERKHGNISAILIELGVPYVEGYKPYANYQRLLFDAVEARLDRSPEVEKLVEEDVQREVSVPTVDDILTALVERPSIQPGRDRVAEDAGAGASPPRRRARIDYLRREADNASLGAAGEQFVLNFEVARLAAARKEDLACRIEHVSRIRGDGDGFDILSYEVSGRERLIEVKTTRYGAGTPFFVSQNELLVSQREADRYHLYRVFSFRQHPRLYELSGSFSGNFALRPTEYLAKIA